MRIVPTAQSDISMSVTWIYDPGDETPQSVIINEFAADGTQLASQRNLAPLGGQPVLFTGLKAGTTYYYQWCGVFASSSGDLTACNEEKWPGTTLAHPPSPGGPPSEGGSAPGGGAVLSHLRVTATAKPFLKIALTWDPADVTAIYRQTLDGSLVSVNVFTEGDSRHTHVTRTGTIDSGPFTLTDRYIYTVYSSVESDSGGIIGMTTSNNVALPQWFQLRDFLSLPPYYDTSLGIRRLLPADRPWISIRTAMSSA